MSDLVRPGESPFDQIRRKDERGEWWSARDVAMNGDPRKPEIVAAQTYFAVKAREAETTRPVTAVPGLSRNDQLKICGNGVVPQQVVAALSSLLAERAGAA